MNNVGLQAAMLKFTPVEMIGPSAGLFQTSRYLGSILSSVVLGLVFSKEITPAHLHILGYVLIVVSGLGCFVSVLLGKRARTV